jgi:hypothetical protein
MFGKSGVVRKDEYLGQYEGSGELFDDQALFKAVTGVEDRKSVV